MPNAKCPMPNGKCPMPNVKCQKCQRPNGKCPTGECLGRGLPFGVRRALAAFTRRGSCVVAKALREVASDDEDGKPSAVVVSPHRRHVPPPHAKQQQQNGKSNGIATRYNKAARARRTPNYTPYQSPGRQSQRLAMPVPNSPPAVLGTPISALASWRLLAKKSRSGQRSLRGERRSQGSRHAYSSNRPGC